MKRITLLNPKISIGHKHHKNPVNHSFLMKFAGRYFAKCSIEKSRLNLCTSLLMAFFMGVSITLSAQYDQSFGAAGLQTLNFLQNHGNEYPTCSVVQPDGKLVVAGFINANPYRVAFIARYNAGTGTRDVTFGQDGVKVLYNTLGDYIINDIVLLSNNEFVFVGERTNGSIREAFWGQTNATGQSMTSVTHGPVGQQACFKTVHVTSLGNYVATGYSYAAGVQQMLITKMDVNGIVDNSFYGTGHYVANELTANTAIKSELYNDTLVVAGYAQHGGTDTIFVRRFIVDGGLGQEDISFNSGSAVKKSFAGDAVPGGIALLPNRDIIVASTVYSTSQDVGLFKIKEDGSLDGTFNATGELILDLGFDDVVSDMIYLSGGKMIFVGKSQESNLEEQFFYGKIADNGSLDSQIKTQAGSVTEGANTLVEFGGDVYISGYSGTNFDVVLLKMSTTLGIDITYGINGFIYDYYLNGNDIVGDVKVQADGKPVMVALTPTASNVELPTVIRLRTDGTLDGSFGSNGRVFFTPVDDDHFNTLAIAADGSVFAVGISRTVTATNVLIAKYTSAGTPVTPFGGGYIRHNLNDSIMDIYSCAVQPDGNIVVAGFYKQGGEKHVCIFRFNGTTGAIDGTFGGGGAVITPLISYDQEFMKILVQPDGKIIVACAAGPSGDHNFAAMRYDEFGVVDASFGTAGYYERSITGNDIVLDAALDPSGNIYLAGTSSGPGIYTNAVLKLNPAGENDSTFATNGISTPSFGSGFSVAFGVFAFSDEILFTSMAEEKLYVVSLTTSGVLDSSYDADGYFIGHTVTVLDGLSSAYSNGTLFVTNNTDNGVEDINVAKLFYTPGVQSTLDPGITVNDVNKVYGDAPFILEATSASPAPITYSVSGCVTIDSETGEIIITCAGTATLTASQVAVVPYLAGSNSATITIAKATPEVVFNNQGAVIGDDPFELLYSTTSDATTPLFSTETTAAYTLTSSGILTALADGSGLVTIVIPATTNYLSVSASATITIYLAPVPPEANPVIVNASVGDTSKFNLLDYAVGKSSPLNPKDIDLDPDQEGVQAKYASPAYGFFSVDTNGLLTFIPIYGFQGEAVISYSIGDDRGYRSDVAELRFIYTLPNPELIPELETKEVFTPNGDGYNDAFVIAFLDNTIKNTFVVYDRNGHEVFKTDEYRNDWVGLDKTGEKLDSGMYYYYFNDELNRTVKGAFLIRR